METILNVLLTGASGTVGTEVMRQLSLSDRIHLTVFDLRNPRTEKHFALYKNRISILWGDLSKLQDVERLPHNLNVVIHLAAIIPPLSDKNPDLARRVNVNGTKHLIKTLENTSASAFLLYSSSIAVYGDHIQNPDISIKDSLNAQESDIYAQTKIESEKLVRDSKLNWSIFRLTAIMRNHKVSKLMFHMPLSTMMEICTAKDTARAFSEAIKHQKELNRRIFNLGGGKLCTISYREFLDRSFKLVGLGNANFPDHAFAERNFHCGMYTDGDILEDILHFRNDTLINYFEDVKQSTTLIKRLFCSIFRPMIKQYLLNQSEPFRAYKSKEVDQMNLFFFPQQNSNAAIQS